MTDHDAIQDMHRRMDTQDKILLEIRDKVADNAARFDEHLKAEKEIKPAIDELITIYKGSKLVIPMFASLAVALWGMWVWAKDHIK